MKRLLLIALSLAFLLPTASFAETFKKPAPDTPHATIITGLKLLRDGDFNSWIKNHCSTNKKCFNEQANSALKRYNLPAMQRRAKNCIKTDDTIEVTRTDVLSKDEAGNSTELKIFVQCETTAMPIPFTLVKEGTTWKFANI